MTDRSSSAPSAASRLKDLRLRGGFSMAEMAKAMGYKTPSGYQRLEDEAAYPDPEFPLAIVRGIARALVGKGRPPITMQHLTPFIGLGSYNRADPLTLHRLFRLPIDSLSVPGQAGKSGSIPIMGYISNDWIEWKVDHDLNDPRGFTPFVSRIDFLGLGADIRYANNDQIAFLVKSDIESTILADGDYILCITDNHHDDEPIIVKDNDIVVLVRTRDNKYQITVRIMIRVRTQDDTIAFLQPNNITEKDALSAAVNVHSLSPFILHSRQFFDEIDENTGDAVGKVRILGKVIGRYTDLTST